MKSHLTPQFPDLLNFDLWLHRLAHRADLPEIRMVACCKQPAGTTLAAGILIRLPVLAVKGLGQGQGCAPSTHPFVPDKKAGRAASDHSEAPASESRQLVPAPKYLLKTSYSQSSISQLMAITVKQEKPSFFSKIKTRSSELTTANRKPTQPIPTRWCWAGLEEIS